MRALAAVLIAVLVSGCMAAPADVDDGDADGDEAREDDPVPEALRWDLQDCVGTMAMVRFEPGDAEDLLPAGFSFLTGPLLDLPGPIPFPVDRAWMGVKILSCASGMEGAVSPFPYATFFFDVAPPEELRSPVAPHFLQPLVLMPDPVLRAWLQERGVHAVPGEVSFAEQPGGHTASVRFDDVGDFSVSTVSLEEFGGYEGLPVREFSPAGEQLLVWDALVDSSHAIRGQGVLEAPSGSLPARLAGSTVIPVETWTGAWTFRDGDLRGLD
jgi:hypothetical protein